VTLADAGGALLGTGYFNPRSLIAIRLLAPPDVEIGKAFLAERLRRALALRERLYTAPFYRLVHAEGDGLPGLVIDRFGDTCVVQITTAGMEHMRDAVLAALDDVVAPSCVVLRNDVAARALEGLEQEVRVVKGVAEAPLRLEENGAVYMTDPAGGQKSGWYYDQRDNRAFMAGLSAGARVLDAFSYGGGFGILALARGAAYARALDSSESALKLARAGAEANGVGSAFDAVKCDVFAELERLAQAGERFETVIADPPPFAPARKDVEAGARAYRRLARAAALVVAPGGFLLLASCSHNMPAARFAAECASGLARAGRAASLIREAGAGPDHPAHPMLPETAYLKALVYALN
jgi:23S rRNA (cytosine1962-C5)-methyltransferase